MSFLDKYTIRAQLIILTLLQYIAFFGLVPINIADVTPKIPVEYAILLSILIYFNEIL